MVQSHDETRIRTEVPQNRLWWRRDFGRRGREGLWNPIPATRAPGPDADAVESIRSWVIERANEDAN